MTYFASHNRWIDTPWNWSFDSTGQWLRARHRHFLPLSPHRRIVCLAKKPTPNSPHTKSISSLTVCGGRWGLTLLRRSVRLNLAEIFPILLNAANYSAGSFAATVPSPSRRSVVEPDEVTMGFYVFAMQSSGVFFVFWPAREHRERHGEIYGRPVLCSEFNGFRFAIDEICERDDETRTEVSHLRRLTWRASAIGLMVKWVIY